MCRLIGDRRADPQAEALDEFTLRLLFVAAPLSVEQAGIETDRQRIGGVTKGKEQRQTSQTAYDFFTDDWEHVDAIVQQVLKSYLLLSCPRQPSNP
jgi:hypothetical protein